MVSIIVPIYNKEKYLNKCIDSILNQTYKDIELILINDGSTDNSLQICKNYEKDQRVKIIDKKNGGVSSARNYGLEKATGSKVLFVDADDYIDTHYIESLCQFTEDLVICGYYTVTPQGTLIQEKSFNISFPNFQEILDNILDKKYTKLLVVPYLKLFDLNLIKKNKISFQTDMSFGEDACFVFDYLKKCKSVRFIPYCGYFNVIIDGTLSRKYVQDMGRQVLMLDNRISQMINNKNIEMIDYWKFRNIKLIIFNEKSQSFSIFKKNIQNVIIDKNMKKKYFSFYDKVIFFLLKNKLFFVLYLIYHFFR